jgi:ligand-binding sensor domain-containing protein/serine phosphatase RsbU (regulator of sigma subunit)
MQDDRGFMWFGTQDGLNRYDGYQIKVFKNDPTTPNSLSNSEIICIEQINPTLICIGTWQGFNLFNSATETFTRVTNLSKLAGKINVIKKFNNETVLIGTDEGLYSLNLKSKSLKNYVFPNNEAVIVKSLTLINNIFYVGTEGKSLWQLKNNSLTAVKFSASEGLTFDLENLSVINDIKEYAGKIYLATKGSGIFKVDSQTFEVEDNILFNKTEAFNSNYISNILIDDNKIFASTAYGLRVNHLLSGNQNAYLKNEEDFQNSINHNYVTCVFRDKEKNIWLGTKLGGVNVAFNQSLKFQLESSDWIKNYKDIYSIAGDKNSTMWFGGLKQLSQINYKLDKAIDHSSILDDNYALCLYKENDNILWVGTWGKGLIRYDVGKKVAYSITTEEFGGTILSIKKDDKNNLWVASIGDGLFKINLATLETRNYGLKEGLQSLSLNTIFFDDKKNMWLGSYDGGILKIKSYSDKLIIEKNYQNKGQPNQIASNTVLDFNQDKNKNIWVATSAGLSKLLSNDVWKSFYEKDGLPNAYLYSILKDSLDNFWMSSNSGIIKFNPLLADKDITFKNYNVKDGLLNTEFNQGAAYISPAGYMYFGGVNGCNVFRPSAIKDNTHYPQTYIINYKRAGKDVVTDSLISYKKTLRLNWRENYFQFEVVALDYTDPTKNKFKFKLEGYDNDWSEPTNVRYISYTELPGGDYTFKVKACNNDGIWNETPTEMKITVVPPFWKTKIFYILIIIIGGTLIYVYTQYRTKAIKKENRLLEDKVALRTKELAEKNHDITSSIEYAKRIQEAILPSKEQIFKKLKKVFILYRPKDIVSGDFYWFAEKDHHYIFAVVDCTGHGVPGAFMSMIGHNLLHQIVSEKGIIDPGQILNNLHKGVQDSLRQGQNEVNTNDGMDVSILSINYQTNHIKWAGANRPLVIVNNNSEFTKYDGNKYPVGGAQMDSNRVFTAHDVQFTSPSMMYMYSDGYADQFGGDKGKKYMVKRFNDLLTNIHQNTTESQKAELEQSFESWRKNHEQVDDVLVVGIGI